MSGDKALRVVVAEPAAASRESLLAILKSDPLLVVVGIASGGLELVEMVRVLRPDVVLLKMRPGGLDTVKATRRIMESDPVPIVLVTAGPRCSDVAGSLDALSAGALAVLNLPTGSDTPGFADECQRIVSTIRTLGAVRVIRRSPLTIPAAEPPPSYPPGRALAGIVAIAGSTGGPSALRLILAGLPSTFPVPILVVQHIAAGFVAGLVNWLDAATTLSVKLAEGGHQAVGGEVCLAPDRLHLGVMRHGRLTLSESPPVGGFRPSGSVLFESVAQSYGAAGLGVVLTGMGEDGVEGLRAMKSAGGYVLAQDESSSLVFGMPAAAIGAGLADEIVPLADMAERISRRVAHG